ncbi:ParB N-terminal domain-containing protein (plasmid) [Acaryochloris sp. 'Moss Beach']|uniref:ParB N-terminal domain-containing protein n=1 Tax=Acaryochloris sp. 'Moss Beach' TaxID=2740837 RepID=UPI001F4042AA|nr:ParB N-terminal domain-containing protein [Acaryochloris sp. 'Moss Beach']UJB72677.1 ParB N-terminal domain-containing protein [Acaryochloris sp. 'Moss Beach']
MARNKSRISVQNIESIPISSITLDHEIQPRCQIYDHVVKKFAAAMRQGEKFPPVIVYYNGAKFWLVDGFHRLRAKEIIGDLEILADVWQGNHQDAVLHAIGANLDSELKLTEADLHKNIYKLIGHPEWKRWSNSEIADLIWSERRIYPSIARAENR